MSLLPLDEAPAPVRCNALEAPVSSDDPCDFPAAHSMDSAWFAVDDDGRVARFDTGEEGAVPHVAAGAGGNLEPACDLLLLDVILSLRAGRPPRGATDPPEHDERVVIVGRAPRDDAPVGNYREAPSGLLRAEDDLDASELVVAQATGPRVLVSRGALSPGRVRALRAHDDADVYVASSLRVHDDDAREGFYEYQHDTSEAAKGSGTYARVSVPASPVRVAELPPELGAALVGAKLRVRFHAAPVVELADHYAEEEVQHWGTPLDPAKAPPPQPPAPTGQRGEASRGALVRVTVVTVVLGALAWLLWTSGR